MSAFAQKRTLASVLFEAILSRSVYVVSKELMATLHIHPRAPKVSI